MTLYLDECQCGVDGTTLGFPHVLLCMAVVLQTNSFLYGMHFDAPTRTTEFAGAFLQFIQGRSGDVANGVRLYGCCDRAKRHHITKNLKATWQAEMTGIANVLGYHGPVTGFDTGIIDPTNGTYIEFQRIPNNNKAEIFYKRHDKMLHGVNYIQPSNRGPASSGNLWTWSTNRNGWEPNKGITHSSTLAPTATTMHKLNYFLRADTFTV